MSIFTKLHLFIIFLLSFSPSVQGRNHVHDPSCVFHPHSSGLRAIDPKYTTRANLAHLEGVKGQTRTGKRLTAAIIDCQFHPEYTHSLMQKGVIHPAVSRKKLIRSLGEPDFNSSSEDVHGSGVLEAIHLVAPEAQFLPIDVVKMSRSVSSDPLVSLAESTYRAIQEAIRQKVDVINVSAHLDGVGYYDRKCFDALKQAIRQGIVVIFAAGNDSLDIHKFRLSQWWNNKVKAFHDDSRRQQFFNEMTGNGLLFAGSLSYEHNGEERLSDFTQIANQSTNYRFLLAPGDHLPIRTSLNPHKLTGGTSFSAPVVAGGYLLLKQYVLDKRYPYGSSNALLDILHRAGNDYFFSQCGSPIERFKSLNIQKALRLADERFGGLPPLPAEPDHTYGTLFTIPEDSLAEETQKPASVATRSALSRLVVRRSAPQKTIVTKLPVAQKPLSRPAITRRPAAKPEVTRRTIVTQRPIARPAIAKRSIPAPRTIVTRQPTIRSTGIVKRATPASRTIVTRQPVIAKRPIIARTTPVKKPVIRAKPVVQRSARPQTVSQRRRR